MVVLGEQSGLRWVGVVWKPKSAEKGEETGLGSLGLGAMISQGMVHYVSSSWAGQMWFPLVHVPGSFPTQWSWASGWLQSGPEGRGRRGIKDRPPSHHPTLSKWWGRKSRRQPRAHLKHNSRTELVQNGPDDFSWVHIHHPDQHPKCLWGVRWGRVYTCIPRSVWMARWIWGLGLELVGNRSVPSAFSPLEWKHKFMCALICTYINELSNI